MQVILAALNAKYIHSSLAVRLLRECAGTDCEIYESNVNVPFDVHYSRLLETAQSGALVGFSVYIWNVTLVVRLCSALKKARPDLTLLLGGPECSGGARSLLERSLADFAIAGEGEPGFGALIDHLRGGSPLSGVPGLWHRSGGEWRSNPESDAHMDSLPFPYPDENLTERIAYYESSRGCPFRCEFCMSAGTRLRERGVDNTMEDVARIMNAGARQVKFIDRTFNARPERARELWARLIGRFGGERVNFHFEIASHLLTNEDFALLKSAPKGLFQFEIGIQSTNEATLREVGRTAPTNAVLDAVRRLVSLKNIHIHLDLIAGLPHEGLESFGRSFDDAFALEANVLQFGFLKLLPGSSLRGRVRELGIEYDAFPPYMALKTDALSALDLIALQRAERAYSRVWSGLFGATARYLIEKFPSPFAFFFELGRAWESVPKNPDETLRALSEFARAHGLLSPLLRELMAFDLLKLENRTLPEFLPEMSKEDVDTARTLLPAAAAKHGVPHPHGRSARLVRFCHDVLGDHSETPIWVLFIYSPERRQIKLV